MLARTSVFFLLLVPAGTAIRLLRARGVQSKKNKSDWAHKNVRVGHEKDRMQNKHFTYGSSGKYPWLKNVSAGMLASSATSYAPSASDDLGADQQRISQGLASHHATKAEQNASRAWFVPEPQNIDFTNTDHALLRNALALEGFVSEAPFKAASSILEKPGNMTSDEKKRERAARLVLPPFLKRRAEAVMYLGEGSYGKVYKLTALKTCLEDRSADADLAVKVMELAGISETEKRNLRQESEIMDIMGKSSEYVIHLVGRPIEFEKKLFLMMPLQNKGEFLNLLASPEKDDRQLGKLPMQVALWFQAVKGVADLHWRGITHMDLKLDNVLINCKGSKCHATVIDLGLACVSKDSRSFKLEAYPCGLEVDAKACIDQAYQEWKAKLQNGELTVNKHNTNKSATIAENRNFFAKQRFRTVYNKDRLPFTDLNEILRNPEHYPITVVSYEFPQDCGLQGTPGFISPEQIQQRVYNGLPSCDIWALGTMLYMIATRRQPPWIGSTHKNTINKTVTFWKAAEARKKIVKELENTEPRVGPKLSSLILSMLVSQEHRVDAGDIMKSMEVVMNELPNSGAQYVSMINTLPSKAGATFVPPACLEEKDTPDIGSRPPAGTDCINKTMMRATLRDGFACGVRSAFNRKADICCKCKVVKNEERVTAYFRDSACS